MIGKSPTYDEVVHLPAGMTEILTGNHRLVNDHPPLFRYFLSLPLFFLKTEVPFSSDAWGEKNPYDRRYNFGKEFFFGCSNDADKLLFIGRLVVVLFAALLGIMVLSFTTLLFGRWPGLFALFIYVFDPSILAHARIAKNDMFLTVFIFMTFYQLYSYFKRKNTWNFVFLGLNLGLAVSTKYSAFMILPIIFFLMLRFYIKQDKNTVKAFFKTLGRIFYLSIISFLVLFFSYVLFSSNAKEYKSRYCDEENLVKEYTMFQYSRNLLNGITGGVTHLQKGHSGYLMGNYTNQRWLRYFPLCFLIKNPISLLLFFFSSLILFFFYYHEDREPNVFLFAIIGGFSLLIMLFSLNLGYRYLLPIHPFIAVYCSIIFVFLIRYGTKIKWMVFIILCIWYVGSAFSIYPHYLAYFNEIIGGPNRGSEYLIDSNLDWGQDLRGVKVYMDKNKIDWIYLIYFGNDDPAYRKIQVAPDNIDLGLVPGKKDNIEKAFLAGVNALDQRKPGYYAISATYFRGGYLDEKDRGFFKFLWNVEPLAKIGHSIFIYKIE
ncbi:MAG: glycosyltransferase family 39 protein [Candidatus Aureabacteria bacterium]|nr:glycosyltransferase family 39 protein [Candidatus Auribacterota bacterium]